ncbi:MAG: hypothetical protein AAFR36_16495, partial [Bacteroidota bacterium]
MMKRLLLFALFALFILGPVFNQTNFTLSTVRQVEHPKLDEQFTDYQTVQLNHEAFYRYFQETEGHMRFSIQTDDRSPLGLNLAPYELRGGAFIRFTESETGRLDSSPATRTSVFRGSVRASDGTSGEAVFTFDEQFVLGRWDEEGITYFLEPLWRFVPDADHELYVVYK